MLKYTCKGEILFCKGRRGEVRTVFVNKYSVHMSKRISVRKKLLIFSYTTYPR